MVNTPYGKTDKFDIEENIMQGTIFGPLFCTTSMSKLGEKVTNKENQF